ncbi:hypothetical protein [Streptomyces sp. NPDC007856]|uniref:nSTAND1 domain-containing NTPase n=1 Tax=Streptomyces sp. NPDC007856 TaxID=3364781 RepID=UPI0036B1F30A
MQERLPDRNRKITLFACATAGDWLTQRRRGRPRWVGVESVGPRGCGRHVQGLARARLLTLDHDTVDLAHEALITAWPRLRQWIDDAREQLRLHRQLTEAARTWNNLDHDPGALYRGSRLTAVEEHLAPDHLTSSGPS